jgi:hypothetical protein
VRAVLRLTISPKIEGCSTGRSAGALQHLIDHDRGMAEDVVGIGGK